VSRQNKTQQRFVTHRAASRSLPPSFRSFILSTVPPVFVPAFAACGEGQKQPDTAEQGF